LRIYESLSFLLSVLFIVLMKARSELLGFGEAKDFSKYRKPDKKG